MGLRVYRTGSARDTGHRDLTFRFCPTLADAIMDRLAGNAHRIELKGESLRKKKSEKKE